MLVLHHTDPDGFGAAVICGFHNPDATFVGVDYGRVWVENEFVHVAPDGKYSVVGEEVVLLDFHLPRELMEVICSYAKSVLVIDHHKTSQGLNDVTEANFQFVCDQDKAAVRLAWETFSPDWPVHWVVDYIEDRDLWRWKLEDSEPINAAICALPLDFEAWDELFAQESSSGTCKAGKAILQANRNSVRQAIDESMEMVEFAGHWVPAVNSALFRSEIGQSLSGDHPFVIIYYRRSDGKWKISMRSNPMSDNWVDVAKIALRYPGGGGHTHAAGFEVDVFPLSFA